MIDMDEVLKHHKAGEELVGIIQRLGGDKDDYKRAYDLINFGIKPKQD